MAKFFITSCGTGIGKTFVTCAITSQMRKSGHNIMALKPLISGWENDVQNNDTLQILEALSLPHSKQNIEKISPWRFIAPLAPSMAARKENVVLDYNKIVDFCKAGLAAHDNLLIEGAGGVMAPLTDHKTNLDLIHDLNIPAILVTGTYLGAISHTLTAIKTLEASGTELHCIIVSESANGVKLADTVSELKNFISYPIYQLSRSANVNFAWQHADNLLKCIF